ncbi:hypothetical protein HGA88_05655 [Candidatus Roizmanbacteria bacterium]|nr:hypothetical protein [Candidatus Roizmanbacteria bacterium]
MAESNPEASQQIQQTESPLALPPDETQKVQTEIYSLTTGSPFDIVWVKSSVKALKNNGKDIVSSEEETAEGTTISVRSASKKRDDQMIERALIEGLTEAVGHKLDETHPVEVYTQEANSLSQLFLDNLMKNEKLYTIFKTWYSTDSWRASSERLRNAFTGDYLPRGPVPLASSPIFEALLAKETRLNEFHGFFDGLSARPDVGELIAYSDSEIAHEALVSTITALNPRSPNLETDFDKKTRSFYDIIRAYNHLTNNPSERALAKNDLLCILDAYRLHGPIVTSLGEKKLNPVMAEYAAKRFPTTRWKMIKAALVLPDHEIVDKAETLVRESCDAFEEINPFATSRGEIQLWLLDTLDEITTDSDPTVFKTLGALLYGSSRAGDQLYAIAERQKQQQPIAELENQFLFEQLQVVSDCPDFKTLLSPSQKMFSGLVKRIRISDEEKRINQTAYNELVTLGKDIHLTENLKANIVSHISAQCRKADPDALMPVLMDMLEIAIGSIDDVHLPALPLSQITSPISFLIQDLNGKMFSAMTDDQRETIVKYKTEVDKQIELLAENKFLPSENQPTSRMDPREAREHLVINANEVVELLKLFPTKKEENT